MFLITHTHIHTQMLVLIQASPAQVHHLLIGLDGERSCSLLRSGWSRTFIFLTVFVCRNLNGVTLLTCQGSDRRVYPAFHSPSPVSVTQ